MGGQSDGGRAGWLLCAVYYVLSIGYTDTDTVLCVFSELPMIRQFDDRAPCDATWLAINIKIIYNIYANNNNDHFFFIQSFEAQKKQASYR